MTNTQPIPQAIPIADHAQLVSLAQASLEDTARKVKAVALDLVNQAQSVALLQLYDDIRRAAIIAQTHVVDLHNDQARQALRAGAELPPDPSSSATGALFPDANPSASQVNPPAPPGDITEQPTRAYRAPAFLQDAT